MYDIAILCGGMATRLYPLTANFPKSLIKINGIPFIYHQLKLLEKNGFKHVVLCLGQFGKQIESYVSSFEIPMDIEYSYDGDVLLGTGGAIKKAIPLLGKNFFVLYGDSYLPIKYKKVESHYSMHSKIGLMTIYKNTNPLHKNNVAVDNNQIIAYDKKEYSDNMQYIDYGLGIFDRIIFEKIKQCSFDLADAYKVLVKAKQLLPFEVEQTFYEIGSHEGIMQLAKYIKEEHGIR